MTYYAVFFNDDGWTCSRFYDVSVYTQEKDETTALETTKNGLLDALKENDVPPLTRAEVEERARQEEREGNLPQGWKIVEIDLD